MDKDLYIFAGCGGVIMFLFGLMLGQASPPPFPRIDGMKPISSSSTKSGSHCTYVRAFGLATRNVKL